MENQKNLRKQLVDQTAHILLGFLIATIFLLAKDWYVAALGGMVLGLLRELSEGSPKFKLKKLKELTAWSWLDISFWTVGTTLAWLVFLH